MQCSSQGPREKFELGPCIYGIQPLGRTRKSPGNSVSGISRDVGFFFKIPASQVITWRAVAAAGAEKLTYSSRGRR